MRGTRTSVFDAQGSQSGRGKVARFDHGEPISKIDTRPMVFVALLVAVFFLVWNVGQERVHAVIIDLPFSWQGSPDFSPPYVTVELTEEGQTLFDGAVIPPSQLANALAARNLDWPLVLFRADPNASYEAVANALNSLRQAGVPPADICFDPNQLAEHRMFQRATTMVESDNIEWSISEIAPSGCEQFYPTFPAS